MPPKAKKYAGAAVPKDAGAAVPKRTPKPKGTPKPKANASPGTGASPPPKRTQTKRTTVPEKTHPARETAHTSSPLRRKRTAKDSDDDAPLITSKQAALSTLGGSGSANDDGEDMSLRANALTARAVNFESVREALRLQLEDSTSLRASEPVGVANGTGNEASTLSPTQCLTCLMADTVHDTLLDGELSLTETIAAPVQIASDSV